MYIVVPVFQPGDELLSLVSSVLRQTYRGVFQVLFVDDGSRGLPEGHPSLDVWALLWDKLRGDGKFCVLVHERNRGLPSALNTGLRHVPADALVSWVSADGVLSPRFVEEFVAAAESHPDMDLFVSPYAYVRDQGAAEDLETGTFDPTSLESPLTALLA